MGLQHYTQDMSKLPLKTNINVLFKRKYSHPMLICRGTDGRTDGRTDARTDGRTHGRTDGRKIFTQYSGISSCSLGSTDLSSLFSPSSDVPAHRHLLPELSFSAYPPNSAKNLMRGLKYTSSSLQINLKWYPLYFLFHMHLSGST